MTTDLEVARSVWGGRIPLSFELAGDEHRETNIAPYYVSLQCCSLYVSLRVGYVAAVVQALSSLFLISNAVCWLLLSVHNRIIATSSMLHGLDTHLAMLGISAARCLPDSVQREGDQRAPINHSCSIDSPTLSKAGRQARRRGVTLANCKIYADGCCYSYCLGLVRL